MAAKISKYSHSDLKSTTDDALTNYLTSLRFEQNHFSTDLRLILGYTAVIISAVLFVADWKLGWEVTKPFTFWAVAIYFTINSFLSLWVWGIENGISFEGSRDGRKVCNQQEGLIAQ